MCKLYNSSVCNTLEADLVLFFMSVGEECIFNILELALHTPR